MDFDHDGDTDLVLGTASGELRYFEQVQPPGWGCPDCWHARLRQHRVPT